MCIFNNKQTVSVTQQLTIRSTLFLSSTNWNDTFPGETSHASFYSPLFQWDKLLSLETIYFYSFVTGLAIGELSPLEMLCSFLPWEWVEELSNMFFLFVLMLYVPFNNFSVLSGWVHVFQGLTSTKQGIKYLAQTSQWIFNSTTGLPYTS